uniref:Major facilitator superfamily (MFS) profile domain-containing protein n=1 Tax=Acrobeloides nanus TaxID=290746 RepID=A0A914DF79_9BILA
MNSKPVEISMRKTNWRSIYLITAFTFLDGIQGSMFFISLWPYLNTIDPTASATFFGIIIAVFSFGQAISAPLFGFWMNKAKTIRPALCFAFILMLISNGVYACTEFFPQHQRKYIMLAARFLIGFGAGDMAVMRAYSATASTIKDRARAVSLVTSSWVFGLVVGPGLQVIFEPFGYPGFKLFGLFHFDMYTAPAWFSALTDLLSIILLWTIFVEEYAGILTEEEKSNPLITLPKPKKLPISICIATRFSASFIVTNAETVGAMFCMAMFDWTNKEAVKYFGLIQLGQSAVNVFVSLSFAWKLGDFVNIHNKERITTIIGLTIGLTYHLLTFAWPFLPEKVSGHVEYSNSNTTEIIGCYKSEYSWCSYTHQVPLLAYILGNIFLQSFAFPVALTPMAILYSKILGSRRQGTMTGILFMSGSIARIIGPILISTMFEHYGPEATWGMQIGVISITILLWIIFYSKIVPLETSPKLKPGESYKYSNGIKYKF